MAIADYKTCDNCGNKAFQDYCVNYNYPGFGTVAALCVGCVKTHKLIAIKKIKKRK